MKPFELRVAKALVNAREIGVGDVASTKRDIRLKFLLIFISRALSFASETQGVISVVRLQADVVLVVCFSLFGLICD